MTTRSSIHVAFLQQAWRFTGAALLLGGLAAALPAAEPRNPKEEAQKAEQLAKSGKKAEALELVIWCYDHGVEVDPTFARVRDLQLPKALARLGRELPAALEALRTRRDATRSQVLAAPKTVGKGDLLRLGSMDLALGDDAGILETLAALQAEPRVRRGYGEAVFKRLVETRHYREAVSVGGFEEDLDAVDAQIAQAGDRIPADKKAGLMQKGALQGAPIIEALAGAGETDRARKIAQRMLRWSDTPEVRAALVKALRRAGAEKLAVEFAPPA